MREEEGGEENKRETESYYGTERVKSIMSKALIVCIHANL